MYLKSLEVHGFKSFANKLVFEFHNGITAIVGPNGSGKSNVADAVRWVLGEQSAKQLRGAKMEDVIFAGTQMRKPLGYAYVAITINNEDHKLNVPYEEVTIARRVYRSGESEYLLNGAACRLRDVQELLFDTGIGKEGYSIIGQGQIDKILSGKPEERRELFDEAAGIVKYKKRKAIAEKNLNEEEQNMVRIDDILSELEKQVGPLERESAKAKEYLKYRDELRNLDVNMFLSDYDTNQNALKENEKNTEIVSDDLEQTKQEFEKTKAEYNSLEETLQQYDVRLNSNRDSLTNAKVALNRQEGEIRVIEEQIASANQNEAQYMQRVAAIEEKLKQADEGEQEYRGQKAEYEKTLQQLQEKQTERQTKYQEIVTAIQNIQQDINQTNQDMISSMNQASSVKTEQQKFETLLDQMKLKRAELTQRVLKCKTEGSVLKEALEQEKQKLMDVSDKIKSMDDTNAEIRNSLAKLRQDGQNLQKEQTHVQQQYHMENSRLHSLQNMTERYEGFGQSIKRVMEQKSNYPGIIGVVADIIRVKKNYEIAIETALGGSIQNIVTDNEQTAKAMIAHLKKNRYGRATFLPLTNISGRAASRAQNVLSEPGVIGLASTLVETDSRFNQLIEYLLGRFIVVDHIDNAIALAKKYHHTIRIVTVEGDLLNPGGSMSGGAYKNNNNLLGRRREMDDLKQRVADLKQQLEELNSDIQKKQEEVKQQQKQFESNGKIKQNLVLQQNTAKLNYDRAQSDLNTNQEEWERIQFDSHELDSKKQEYEDSLGKIQEQIASSQDRSKQKEEKIAACNAQLEQLQEREKIQSQENNTAVVEIAAQKQNCQFAQENIDRIVQERAQYQQQKQDLESNKEMASQQMLEKQKEIDAKKNDITACQELIAKLEQTIDKETQEKNNLNQQHKGFLERREQLSDRINELDKEVFRLNNQKEKLESSMENYTNYMWEQYELTYHTAEQLQTDTNMSTAEMKKQIGKLKGQIKALGDVNVNSVEQFKEVQERYELLKTQHDDLVTAADELKKVIEELDTEMRKQFEEQFAEIKNRFDHVFKELFGGGRGTLELVEDEDILTAGIRIIAQPPGKKLQNMMQLSGGEKALTAIALLFAIQSLKPSPFCLLDEIEAALDDSNVSRFADYLHKLTKDTQFIVITHRRGTMNAADILYGITMQEKGVSTMVSVNLLDEKEIAN